MSRFGNQVTSEEDLAKPSKGFVPKSTAESMQWALRNFESWQLCHCERLPDDPVPDHLLEKNDPVFVKQVSLSVCNGDTLN